MSVDHLVITILTAHRSNLLKANTFEEYRTAQIKYIDFLIEKEEAKEAELKACVDFISTSESAERVEL